jgi:hypothetical protein
LTIVDTTTARADRERRSEMSTLPAWMIAQDLDRYARDAMHRAALRDSRAADDTSTGSPSGLIARTRDLRRRLAGRPAGATAACCAA